MCTDFAKEYKEKMFPNGTDSLDQSDADYIERFNAFAYDEVVNEESVKLDDKTRFMAILSVLLGCQGIEAFRAVLPGAYAFGVTPVEMKEIVYQAVDYLGMGRVYPFFQAVNAFLGEKGIALPLESQATTTMETRLEAGAQAQADIFGEQMLTSYKTGPQETMHIRRWLADNCFGDVYTRNGLDLKQREMCTFCYIYAQGGCEPQLIAHAKGNMNLGNDRAFLLSVVSNCVPYIGYPRTLNAISCIDKACE